ncbi:hypothetical protein A3K29_02125 [Candidatus Collierbacteria bacterium RIFOXYB2_FULL_46_14]|uniref:rRNA (Adenine-N(6)-)-methyltransferase n=1 Tax=Candidatus Collierbacteria bacterium GW2011_GWA2_46_26 TaxID=1618381 RepID=A0A0G1PJS1_9BACT|nr:MAG: rRNA (Adenine-N(6)-)-methyltransferase [Candidatus Collierbacteria bacterium GW2011_GWC2_44_13]KKU32947.1 MAG: rRNA (Adenine-N(6)-)-methyltransferase [Candidatus Collierbacteria bacterium GW2011_GWA2_46_26]OGD72923.1 MAG: hypothetical protein A3K29_02125 [Candidatus Collierbacteria bacterium RIFOXYB2_FULL_46_14]OGD75965.1 MAG: hypothetical protein A3K43_02125 [Candidatus Collierbacteria bacterium RIFOXYA2_FULL_46_20]OGD77301.1 MAG: hypothetical protein A3K39_02125 [Candidatus Collierbac
MFKTRRKLLSQNFLRDEGLITRLIRASGISCKDTVLDIGAGNGNIAEALLSISRKVIAIEIDKALAVQMSRRLENHKALGIVCGDFLDFDLPKEPYKVFSNIPFAITGEIVKKLLFSDNPPETCVLIVQKEAAQKFVINPKKQSMLSILFYPWFDITVGHVFERTDFYPTPIVNTCLLKIVKRPTPLVPDGEMNKYRDFVVYKYTKCRSVGEWSAVRWINTYTNDVHCRGSFAKWQREQRKLVKIHRTRTDKKWKQFS